MHSTRRLQRYPAFDDAWRTQGDFGWRGPAGRLPVVQTKLRVNAPNDRYEQEADRIGDQVAGGRSVNAAAISSVASGALQRTCSCGGSGECDECRKKKEEGMVQRKSLDSALSASADPVTSAVSGSGRTMSRDVRGFFEERMGTSFDHVRIHDDATAAESARSLNARAYTTGKDIVFGAGEYRPETESGNRLLAHELVHVVQQGGIQGGPYRSVEQTTSPTGARRFSLGPSLEQEPPALEHQADTLASSTLAGGLSLAERSALRSTRGGALQRNRIPLSPPLSMCGYQVTHVDVYDGRWKGLDGAKCVPQGASVYRVNVVGRQVSQNTKGNGKVVFNLHIGYYEDPVTGEYCAVVDDSEECICGRCEFHQCLPTAKEALDAAYEFAKIVLKVLGVVVLAAIAVEILEALLGLAAAALLADRGPASGTKENSSQRESTGSERV
jgi:hypothetical protein